MIRSVLLSVFLASACGPSPEVEPEAPKVTGLYVESVQGSGRVFTIRNVETDEVLCCGSSTDQIVEVPPGTYRLNVRGFTKWLYAESVVVVEGQVTRVRLSAIRVTADPSWEGTEFDVRALSGDAGQGYLKANELIPFAPGSYAISHHYQPQYLFGTVSALPGEIAGVTLGGIQRPVGAFRVFELDCETLLDPWNPSPTPHGAPAGKFCVKDENLAILASEVTVVAGAVTSL